MTKASHDPMVDLPPVFWGWLGGLVTAMLGGVAHAAHDWLTGKNRHTWRQFAAECLVSLFMGVLAMHFFTAYAPQWTGAGCGIMGWLGGRGIPLIMMIVKKQLGAGKDKPE